MFLYTQVIFLAGFNVVQDERKMLPDERVQTYSGEYQRLAQAGG